MAYVKTNLVARFLRESNDTLVTIVGFDLKDDSTDVVVGSGREPTVVTNATAEELAAVKSVIAKALVLAAG